MVRPDPKADELVHDGVVLVGLPFWVGLQRFRCLTLRCEVISIPHCVQTLVDAVPLAREAVLHPADLSFRLRQVEHQILAGVPLDFIRLWHGELTAGRVDEAELVVMLPLVRLKVEIICLVLDVAFTCVRVVDPQLRSVDLVGARLLDQV